MPRWTVHGEEVLYDSAWLRLLRVDLELPDGTNVDHFVIRIPFEVVSLVVADRERGVLMLRRHRFVVDRWVWDVPAGKVAEGESPAGAAARAALEETGWQAGPVRYLGAYHPSPGISDQRFHVCVADGGERVGEPNANEADEVRWVPVARVGELLRSGEVDGLSLTSLLWALAAGELSPT